MRESNSGDDSSSLRHWLMHLIVEIWDSLNCKNNSYFDMCTAMQSTVVVVVVVFVVVVVNVMEALHFVVADDYDRC